MINSLFILLTVLFKINTKTENMYKYIINSKVFNKIGLRTIK